MLTPEYLDRLGYKNKVLDIYQQLNIDITADIIKRVKTVDFSITKSQMRQLLRTGGKEIFEKTLKETTLISSDVKTELRREFEAMVKEDLESYKPLYEYRDEEYKLTSEQMKILNQGLKQTNNELKNFGKSIAFASEEMYINAVDKAYMQVVTGGVDYIQAIENAVDELAENGVTLKSGGRNYQLESTVRYQVLRGIQETANHVNEDIDELLECDGVETTAHAGARPSHTVWQGKQFAKNPKDAKKFGVELWDDVKDELNDYNCRHTYFGVILGVSEPIYTKKELNGFKNQKVSYDGKEMDLYDATQKQRYYERQIRNVKKSIQICDKAGIDYDKFKKSLISYEEKYKDFSKQTGLDLQWERTRIANEK